MRISMCTVPSLRAVGVSASISCSSREGSRLFPRQPPKTHAPSLASSPAAPPACAAGSCTRPGTPRDAGAPRRSRGLPVGHHRQPPAPIGPADLFHAPAAHGSSGHTGRDGGTDVDTSLLHHAGTPGQRGAGVAGGRRVGLAGHCERVSFPPPRPACAALVAPAVTHATGVHCGCPGPAVAAGGSAAAASAAASLLAGA